VAGAFTGQVAFVTGGASGIGRASAVALARHGAEVAILDRDSDGIRSVVGEIEALGVRALGVHADLLDVESLPARTQDVLRALGRIDIFCNVAGIMGHRDFLKETPESWDRVQTINLKAPWRLLQVIAQHMIDRGGGGKIVTVSSSSAFRAAGVQPSYAASKAALVQLTKVVAKLLGPYDVNVNCVAPGVTRTPMSGRPLDSPDWDEKVSSGPVENFFHRVADADDVAAAIVWLCLPESKQITGQVIHTSAGAIT
jgi:NAD(P)-dependent dehydrogenase (short-subunit alcohol dehydrogenase family)